jgi:hypothetical protein
MTDEQFEEIREIGRDQQVRRWRRGELYTEILGQGNVPTEALDAVMAQLGKDAPDSRDVILAERDEWLAVRDTLT